MSDPTPSDASRWLALVTRYYDRCSAGDVQRIVSTLHPDVVHWFLKPNTGSHAVEGAQHLTRYWRKVAGMIRARWVVDSICAAQTQAVIEWSMFWQPQGGTRRVVTRGAEWFMFEDATHPRDPLVLPDAARGHGARWLSVRAARLLRRGGRAQHDPSGGRPMGARGVSGRRRWLVRRPSLQ